MRFPVPVGFVYDGDKIVLDPDQEVQGAVRAVFELFEQENSAYRVVQRFHQLGLRFPRRAYGGAWDGKLIWGRLTHSRVIGVLANPCYAGTYVFGRYQSCKKIDATGEICSRLRRFTIPIPVRFVSKSAGRLGPSLPTWRLSTPSACVAATWI